MLLCDDYHITRLCEEELRVQIVNIGRMSVFLRKTMDIKMEGWMGGWRDEWMDV